MIIGNYLNLTDKQFLARSICCWQAALKRGDMIAFKYWAVHCWCFARTLL